MTVIRFNNNDLVVLEHVTFVRKSEQEGKPAIDIYFGGYHYMTEVYNAIENRDKDFEVLFQKLQFTHTNK